jgi:hypothetical protein
MERRHYVPMDKNEKAKIVERVEKRLAKWIIDANTEIPKTVHITKTVTVEEDVEAPTLYDTLYKEAIERLGQNRDSN